LFALAPVISILLLRSQLPTKPQAEEMKRVVGLPLFVPALASRTPAAGLVLRGTRLLATTAGGAPSGAAERLRSGSAETGKLWAALAAHGPAFPLRATSGGDESVQILPTPDDFFNQLKALLHHFYYFYFYYIF
jgi:hypothetical protein